MNIFIGTIFYKLSTNESGIQISHLVNKYNIFPSTFRNKKHHIQLSKGIAGDPIPQLSYNKSLIISPIWRFNKDRILIFSNKKVRNLNIVIKPTSCIGRFDDIISNSLFTRCLSWYIFILKYFFIDYRKETILSQSNIFRICYTLLNMWNSTSSFLNSWWNISKTIYNW